ncbi:type VI secretion system baseplate subunit TssK [Desulfoluna sp.]|uniref:type VI secretion system baseplate subunit TssK n=1 Tax=Desulfoluna sp. TaxID=2045199 RepID=UPI0026087E64|nr:type VI secretion system baseplate subunit TssK [Desulfoluna sp.]
MEKPLFWHQGLFLQPQHLQLTHGYHESLLTPFNRHLQPHLNGVGALSIRRSAVSGQSIHIDTGAFWFLDGTYAVIGENALLEARRFQDSWVDGSKPLVVYVGVKKTNRLQRNVTVLKSGVNPAVVTTRYVVGEEPESMNDLHHDGPPALLKTMSLLLKVFFHSELDQLGGYELIPVAMLERSGDETVLSSRFIPPVYTLNASPALWGLVQDIYDQLSYKGHDLESYKKKRGVHNAEFGSRDMVFLLSLRTLNRYIPKLAHLIEHKEVHPWDLYAILRQIIGELSSFSDRVNVLGDREEGGEGLPAYDHNNLWHCYSQAGLVLASLLEEITSGPEYIIEFQRDDPYLSVMLLPSHLEANSQYYMVVTGAVEKDEILEAVNIGVKLGSKASVPAFVERSLPGIGLEHLTTPPQELPRRGDSSYFRIDTQDDRWLRVEREKHLCLYWEGLSDVMKVEIMIVRRH